MSDIGRALASGYGRDFNATNARLVRAGDDVVDNDELRYISFRSYNSNPDMFFFSILFFAPQCG